MMRSRLSPDELGIFYRQLAVMLRSGVALPEAVTALSAEKELPRIKKRVGRIKKDMAEGSSFIECLTGQRDLFNPALAKILALDHNAQTADILIRFAEIEERSSEIGNTPKTLMKSLLFYPSIVLCVVITITILMLIFVIPVFEEMFVSMGGGLPHPTQLVFDISRMITATPLYPVLLLVIIAALLIYGKEIFYWAAAKIPTIRAILKKIAVAEFAEYFSLMIAAGLPFKESLVGSANSVKNPYFSALLKGVADRVADISELQVQMKKSGLFPEMLIQVAAVSNTLENIGAAMGEAAAFYSKNAGKIAAKKLALFEMFILFLLSVFVGGLVISMYLPIFTMADAI